MGNAVNQRHVQFALEGQDTRQHLVKNHTQRPDIRLLVGILPPDLFGRHVGHCSHDRARPGHAGCN